MKVFSKIKLSMRKSLVLGAVTAAAIAGGIFATNAVNAASYGNCDNNAVVPGGVSSVRAIEAAYGGGASCSNGATYSASAASIQHIYNYFGITGTTFGDTATTGSVSSTGNVYSGSTLVATNALTAGRQYIAGGSGSHEVTYDGTVFYTREPNVSFRDSSLSAIIFSKNGVFQYAVLNSCGNPIKATPRVQPKPNYTINKTVAISGTSAYEKTVAVKSGTDVNYQIDITSTGNAPLTGLIASDSLPANVSYVANTMRLNGTALSAASAASLFTPGGLRIGTLNPGSQAVIQFTAKVGSGDTITDCTPQDLVNTGRMLAIGLRGETSTAQVDKSCLPKPVYACTALTSTMDSRTEYTFKAAASANDGAVITGYLFTFGDGQSTQTLASAPSVQHQYAGTGTFNVGVSALVSINGAAAIPVTSAACETKVTIPAQPIAECTGLTAAYGTGMEVTLTASDNAMNGAALTGISYDFGDNTPAVTGTTLAPVSHTYAQAGDYTAVATLTFSGLPAGANTSTCSVPISFSAPPAVYTCNDFTLTTVGDRMVTASNFQTTATNATFTGVDVYWGDNQSDKNVIAASVPHTYTNYGDYTVLVVAHFDVDGQDVTASSANCQKSVTFTAPPVTPTCPTGETGTYPNCVTPTTPSVLVNTGAGNVAEIFAVVAIAGALAHRLFLSRRLSRNE